MGASTETDPMEDTMNALLLIAADAVAIALLCTFSYLRHRRRDLLVAFVGVNVGVLAVSVVLAGTEVALGLGLGIAHLRGHPGIGDLDHETDVAVVHHQGANQVGGHQVPTAGNRHLGQDRKNFVARNRHVTPRISCVIRHNDRPGTGPQVGHAGPAA